MANAQAPAPPQIDPNAPVYVVGYVDVVVASKAQAMKLLKQYRTSCAKEDGNLRCEAAQRIEQQNEFVVLEVWKDQKTFQTHSSGPGAQLKGTLKPMLGSPYDERVHKAFSVQPPQPAPNGRIVYVVTHVDVIPPKLDDTLALLGPAAEAGRKDVGNGRLEVLQQQQRGNHFSVIEIWSNKRQLETHQALARTIQFREALQPFTGALYDERLYKILD
ncbi:MAG: putative quinol monooxygenase [Rhizomicrobium sp.]